MLILVTGISSAAIGLSFRTPLSSCCGREIDATDLDDGLPGGFLVGAIVKVRVTHRLNWACELLRRRGEELARDVGSELRGLEVPASRGLRRLGHAGDELHQWNHQPLHDHAKV